MKKELTIGEFLKINWLLILILPSLLIISIILFLFVFQKSLYDVGAWASLVAGIFTYLGSSFLGVVVFYNTQSTQRQKEIEDQITIEIKHYLNTSENPSFFIPYIDNDIDKEKFFYHSIQYNQNRKEATLNNLSYLYFEVTNRNTHVPVYVKPVSIYIFNGKKFIDIGYNSYYSDMDDSDAIDYKQKKSCYIGVNKQFLKDDYYLSDEHQLCCVGIKITSIKGQVLYTSLEYFMGVSLGVNNPTYITEEQFNENVAKFGGPSYTQIYKDYTIKGLGARKANH